MNLEIIFAALTLLGSVLCFMIPLYLLFRKDKANPSSKFRKYQAKICPGCGASPAHATLLGEIDRWVCGSYRRHTEEFCQGDECRITQLESTVIHLDRMASQQLQHGTDAVRPFAREVFDICEGVLSDSE